MSIRHSRRSVSHALAPALEGAAIAGSIALIEHIALWDYQERVPLTARYALGTAAILAGLAHTCRRVGRLDLALSAWGIACAAGAVVAGAHRLRRLRPDDLDRLIQDGDSHAVWIDRARRA